ncbi:hypothetical protein VNO77_04715 [Canavalia gladiata]|uniref:Uncharacterized protein n=1 Tax=Canavalia gladiata TaxID=3824 RepID=A0AAN9RDG9_CANGL
MFFPWETDSVAKFRILRLVFHGIGYFSLCASTCTRLYEPCKTVSSYSKSFVIPNLPGDIKMTRLYMSNHVKSKDSSSKVSKLFKEIEELGAKSYGVVVNSFYELEQVYVDYYSKELERREWHIGPLSLCNKDKEGKRYRGMETSINQ